MQDEHARESVHWGWADNEGFYVLDTRCQLPDVLDAYFLQYRYTMDTLLQEAKEKRMDMLS